jgi:Na+/H+ antiporter NhaD/arsenite permease-like protein
MVSRFRFLALVAMLLLVPQAALAAPALDGAAMGWPWALPFLGILLSIATGPLLFPDIWHNHYGKIAFGWAALTLLPLAALFGLPSALAAFLHAVFAEYLSFIVLLFSLYVVAGGILITGSLRGTPWTNAGILAFGAGIASFVGTTGAAMILIRPLIRANAGRARNAHVVIFFIFLVANIGGALTPLGDPPLFVGFLRGVEFF